MRIEVTQEHIDKSEELRKENFGKWVKCCPIALAVRAAGFPKAEMGYTNVWPHGGITGEIPVPTIVTQFVHAVDRRQPVEPFSFELDLEATRVD